MQNNFNIGSRIKEERIRIGSTQSDLASLAGATRHSVANWESGSAQPPAVAIAAMEAAGVDVLYVVTGKRNAPNQLPTADSETVAIPQYDVALSAGSGRYASDQAIAVGHKVFDVDWLQKKGLHPQNLVLLTIFGDSMADMLYHGDLVMLDTSVTKPVAEAAMAFRLAGDLYVKLCHRDGSGNLCLVSVNKAYDPIVIDSKRPPDDFAILGLVVWSGHSWI